VGVKLKTLQPRVAASPGTLQTLTPGAWRTDERSSTQRGYGYAWQKAREGYLRLHPLCVMCEAQGVVRIATVVDHIDPHRGNMAIFWDSSRWQSLCKPHHDSDAQKKDNAYDMRSSPTGRGEA
jgi:5-methylcytosine-specific restriction protein A